MIRCLHCDSVIEDAVVAVCSMNCLVLIGVRYAVREAFFRAGVISENEIFSDNPDFVGRAYVGERIESLFFKGGNDES